MSSAASDDAGPSKARGLPSHTKQDSKNQSSSSHHDDHAGNASSHSRKRPVHSGAGPDHDKGSNGRGATGGGGGGGGEKSRKKARGSAGAFKTTSCENCRRRKLKCDRTFPCSGCVLRNEVHRCKWEPGTRPPSRTSAVTPSGPLLERIERIEKMAAALAESFGISDDDAEHEHQHEPEHEHQHEPEHEHEHEHEHEYEHEHEPEPEHGHNHQNGQVMHTSDSHTSVHAPHLASPGGPISRMRRRSVAGSIPVVPPDKEDISSFTMPFSIRDDWKSSQQATRQTCLHELIEVLPPLALSKSMSDAFFDHVLLFAYIIDRRTFNERLDALEAYRSQPDSEKANVSGAEAHRLLEYSALVWAICSTALVETGQQAFEGLLDLYEQPIVSFMDAAMQALDSCQGVQIPSIETVRVQILVARLMHVLRGDSWGSVIYLLAIANAFAVQLHKEPPPDLPETAFYDRIRLFTFIMFIDAFGTGGTHARRGCLVPDNGAYSTPSFLYSEASWTAATDDGPWPKDLKVLFELSRIMSKSTGRQYMSEDESYSLTMELQQQLDQLVSRVSPALLVETPDMWGPNRSMTVSAGLRLAFNHVSLALHGRHYVAGWLNPRYASSRNVCLQAASAIVRAFLSFVSLFVPLDRIESLDQAEVLNELQNPEKVFAGRGCFFFLGRKAAPCGLLLQHHLYMVANHPDQVASAPAGLERSEILHMLKQLKMVLDLVGTSMKIDQTIVADLLLRGMDQPNAAWRDPSLMDGTGPIPARDRRSSMSSGLQRVSEHPFPATPLLTQLPLAVHSDPNSPLSSGRWPALQGAANQGMSLEQDASLVADAPWFQQTFVDFETLVSSLLASDPFWASNPNTDPAHTPASQPALNLCTSSQAAAPGAFSPASVASMGRVPSMGFPEPMSYPAPVGNVPSSQPMAVHPTSNGAPNPGPWVHAPRPSPRDCTVASPANGLEYGYASER